MLPPCLNPRNVSTIRPDPLSFPPHFRRFPVLSFHPIFGPHPRIRIPLQPDSSISRGSKSYRFYEPPRHAYMHARVARRNEAMSAIYVTRALRGRFSRTENFPVVTKKTRATVERTYERIQIRASSRPVDSAGWSHKVVPGRVDGDSDRKNTLSPFCSGKLDRQVRRRIRRTRRGKFRVSAQ